MASLRRTTAARFTVPDVRARLSRLGDPGVDEETGDHVLGVDAARLVEGSPAREAAVLVPIVDDGEAASVILTTRAGGLRKHAGQIAFPGGSIDPGDASAEAAALREALEEIGLEPRYVETLGRLPPYRTTTGFLITPVIAVVSRGFSLRPDPAEVADVFEVPLAFLMDAANHVTASRTWQGQERSFYVMPFGERHIWGVTAGIIRTLYERLYA